MHFCIAAGMCVPPAAYCRLPPDTTLPSLVATAAACAFTSRTVVVVITSSTRAGHIRGARRQQQQRRRRRAATKRVDGLRSHNLHDSLLCPPPDTARHFASHSQSTAFGVDPCPDTTRARPQSPIPDRAMRASPSRRRRAPCVCQKPSFKVCVQRTSVPFTRL